jgi:hypothetical protein
MTRTFLRAMKVATLSVAVLTASSLMSLPASAQANDDKDYNGELAVLLLNGSSQAGNGRDDGWTVGVRELKHPATPAALKIKRQGLLDSRLRGK